MSEEIKTKLIRIAQNSVFDKRHAAIIIHKGKDRGYWL